MAHRTGLPGALPAHGIVDKETIAQGDRWKSVYFNIGPSGVVSDHTNPGTVTVLVLDGDGFATLGEDGEHPVVKNDYLRFAPGERHGFRAGSPGLRLIAHIIQEKD